VAEGGGAEGDAAPQCSISGQLRVSVGGEWRASREQKMLKYEDSRYACLFEYLTPVTRFLGLFTSVGECTCLPLHKQNYYYYFLLNF